MSFVQRWRVRNHDLADPWRAHKVLATPEEIGSLVRDGYLVRRGMLNADNTRRMRTALDSIAAAEREAENLEVVRSRRFGGQFLRHLMDKHPVFLELLHFSPTVSVARAVLGPMVQIRGLSARISFPEQPNQETHWHFHQRLIPDPLPLFFSRPHTLDCLIYLDAADDANGPLVVLPGSHDQIQEDLPSDCFDDLPDQVALRLAPGDCVICHGALWHRAMPTLSHGTVRRLLLLGYGPTWLKSSIYGEKPTDGLTQKLLADADEETKELLGASGWM